MDLSPKKFTEGPFVTEEWLASPFGQDAAMSGSLDCASFGAAGTLVQKGTPLRYDAATKSWKPGFIDNGNGTFTQNVDAHLKESVRTSSATNVGCAVQFFGIGYVEKIPGIPDGETFDVDNGAKNFSYR